MFCKHCGYQNEAGAKFCTHCGKQLSENGGRKKLVIGLMTVMILAAGIVTGTLLFGGKPKAESASLVQTQQFEVDAAEDHAPETTAKPDPLVLAYSAKTDTAPACYYYNEAGQLVRKVQEQWDQVTNYEYHANGTLQTETVIRDGSIYYVTEYDDHGNPVAKHSAGELVYSYTNQYDNQGRLVSCTKTAEGESKEVYRYTYDEDGCYELDYMYITFYDGEELVHDQVWRRYSPEGVLVHESWEVADYLPGNKGTIYTLDEHGNLVMKSYQSWSDTTRQRDDTYYEHTYNSKGLVTKTEVTYCGYYMSPEYNTNTDITLKEIITYTYDSEGRMIGKNIQNVEGGFTIENVWEYDEAGNLIRFYGLPDDENSWYTEEIRQYKPLSEVLYSDK